MEFLKWMEVQFGAKWSNAQEVANQEQIVDDLRKRLAHQQRKLDKMRLSNKMLEVAERVRQGMGKSFTA